MARVQVVAETGESRTVEFQTELYIGRDKSNQVVLTDPSCSRHHALIRLEGEGFAVTDLGSNNGILVNGLRTQRAKLRSGDQVQLGRVVLVFQTENGGATEIVTVESDELQVRPTSIVTARDSKRRLSDLYDVLRAISGQVGTRDVLRALCESVRRVLACDTVAAVGRDEIVSSADGPATISQSILEAGRAQAALFSGSDLAGRQSVVRHQISSALCGPIELSWVLYADTRQKGRDFTTDDLEFFAAAALQAGLALRSAALFDRTRSEVQELKRYFSDRLVGRSQVFVDALSMAHKAAASEATVLVLGESGTGKELVARLIHDSGPRASGPFVALNCAALVESLLESELFGYEKGAFTGATRTRPGKFEAAEGGTLFLDEICEVSPATQAKLLRAIQERNFYRVGGLQTIAVDVRLIAATNRDIEREVKEGRFREDLYYRLAVLKLRLPALRERRDDIALLAHHFLQTYATQMKKPVRKIAASAVSRLESYAWPGNVRELQNVIERAVVLAEGDTITPELIPLEARPPAPDLPMNLEEAEKLIIQRALEQTGGKKGEAIKLLGISWPTLNKKLKEYGLE